MNTEHIKEVNKTGFGIIARLNLLLGLAIVLFGWLVSNTLNSYVSKEMLSEHQRRIDLLMKTLCVSAEVPFQTGDNMEVAKMGLAALKQQDVVACKIEDADHNTMFWNGRSDSNRGIWINDTVFTTFSKLLACITDSTLAGSKTVA